MAEISKFFNAVEIAPGVFDREYQASDFADYFGSVLSTGLLHTNQTPGMSVSVETGTLNTIVSPGKAIMKGQLYENTTSKTLNHALPETSLNRIDRIVLRLDLRNAGRETLLHVKTGVADTNPVAPLLQRDNFIYEISLAQILVRANTVQLLQSDLVDERLDESLCGLVYSLISIPTSQFEAEWRAFMDGIQDEGFATVASVQAVEDELTTHKADYVKHPGISATGGTSKAYTVTLDPAPLDIPEFFGITIIPHITNVASPTLTINGLETIALKDQKGVAYAAGKLLAGKPYMFRKVGSDFLADSGSGGGGNLQPNQALAGYTFLNDDGEKVGAMPNRGNVGTQNLASQNAQYVIPEGYHNGAGRVQATYPAGKQKYTNQMGAVSNLTITVSFRMHTIIAANSAGGMTVFTRGYNGLWIGSLGTSSPMPYVAVDSDHSLRITNYSGNCLLTIYED